MSCEVRPAAYGLVQDARFGVAAGWLVEEMRNHGVEPRLRWDVMRKNSWP